MNANGSLAAAGRRRFSIESFTVSQLFTPCPGGGTVCREANVCNECAWRSAAGPAMVRRSRRSVPVLLFGAPPDAKRLGAVAGARARRLRAATVRGKPRVPRRSVPYGRRVAPQLSQKWPSRAGGLRAWWGCSLSRCLAELPVLIPAPHEDVARGEQRGRVRCRSPPRVFGWAPPCPPPRRTRAAPRRPRGLGLRDVVVALCRAAPSRDRTPTAPAPRARRDEGGMAALEPALARGDGGHPLPFHHPHLEATTHPRLRTA